MYFRNELYKKIRFIEIWGMRIEMNVEEKL